MKNNFNDSENSDPTKDEYRYQAAGIRERKGFVPLWLVLIAVGLIIWALYYLFHFWSPN